MPIVSKILSLTEIKAGKKPEERWVSDGVRSKPKECQLCKYYKIGSGFCGDYYPENPKISIMMTAPRSDDLLEQVPMSSPSSKYWLQNYFSPAGLDKKDIMVCNVIRCMPPANKFPLKNPKDSIVNSCRVYDSYHLHNGELKLGGIAGYNPNVAILTYHPVDVLKVGAYHRQIVADVQKAVNFHNLGYRPVLLMGDEAVELLAPWIYGKGGLPKWRGHWFEIEGWPVLQKKVSKYTL